MSRKSISVIRKRGRPPTGQDPVTALRLAGSLKSRIDHWAEQQEDKPTRSAAIRRLVELALGGQARAQQVFYRLAQPQDLFNRKTIKADPSNCVTIRQVKAARALLGWSQSTLAAYSNVSEPTIARLESTEGKMGGRRETVRKIRKALEAAGIEFINGDQPGVRLTRTTDEWRTTSPGTAIPVAQDKAREAGRRKSKLPR